MSEAPFLVPRAPRRVAHFPVTTTIGEPLPPPPPLRPTSRKEREKCGTPADLIHHNYTFSHGPNWSF
jgi:hypothetical protein